MRLAEKILSFFFSLIYFLSGHFASTGPSLQVNIDSRYRQWNTSPVIINVGGQVKEALSVLMLCAPSNRWRPFLYHTKMMDFKYFRVLSVFSWYKLRKVY